MRQGVSRYHSSSCRDILGVFFEHVPEITCGRSGGSIPSRDRRFFCSTKCPDYLWGPSNLQEVPGIKLLGHENNHSPPSSAKVKNEWSYTWNEQRQIYMYFAKSALLLDEDVQWVEI